MPYLQNSLLLWALVASPIFAAEPFRWDWSEGETASYLLLQTTIIDMNAASAGGGATTTRQATLIDWSVDSFGANGATIIRQQPTRVVVNIFEPLGNKFRYDTDQEDQPFGPASAQASNLRAKVSAPFMMNMLPTGKVTGVRLSRDLTSAYKQLSVSETAAERVEQSARQLSVEFPEDPIEVGESWSRTDELTVPEMGVMQLTTTYTYEGLQSTDDRECDAFTLTNKVESFEPTAPYDVAVKTRDSTGELLFDRELGRIHRLELDQNLDIQINIKTPKGNKPVTGTITQNYDLRVLTEGQDPDLIALVETEE